MKTSSADGAKWTSCIDGVMLISTRARRRIERLENSGRLKYVPEKAVGPSRHAIILHANIHFNELCIFTLFLKEKEAARSKQDVKVWFSPEQLEGTS